MKRLPYHTMLKAMLWVFLSLLLVLLSFSAYVAGTTSGARWALALGKQWAPGLHLRIIDGSLLRGLRIEDVRYQDAGLELEIDALMVDLSTRDLVLPRIKLQQLHAHGIRLLIGAKPSAEIPQPNTATMQLPSWLPPVILADTQIDTIRLQLPQLHAELERITLTGRLQDGRARVKMLAVKGADWHILPSSGPTAESEWPLTALPLLEAPLPIELTQINIENTRIHQDGQTWAVDRLVSGLTWQGQTLHVPTFTLEAADYGQLSLTAGATLVPPYQIEMDGRLQVAAGLLPAPVNLSPIAFHSQGALNALSIHVRQPSPQIDITANVDLTQPSLPFSATLNADSHALSQLLPLPDEAQLQLGRLQGQVQGTLTQQKLQLNLAFRGFGLGNEQDPANLNLSALHENASLTVDHLELGDKATGSALSATGKLTYGDGLQWQVESQLAAIRVDTPLSPVKGHFSGKVTHQGRWRENGYTLALEHLELTGDLEGTPLHVLASGQLDTVGQMQVEGLTVDIQALDSTLKLNGQVGETWAIEGTLESNKLSRLHPDIRGKLQSSLTLSGPVDDPLLKVNGKFEHLRMGIQNLSDVTFNATYQMARQHALTLAAHAAHIILNENQLFGAELSLQGDAHQHVLTLHTQGDIEAELTLDGRLDSTLSQWSATLNHARLAMLDEKWRLSAPVPMQIGRDTLQIGGHCWQGLYSELCLTAADWQVARQLQITGKVDAGAWFAPVLREQQLQAKAELAATLSVDDSVSLDVTATLGQGMISQQFQQAFLPLLSWQQGSLSLVVQEGNVRLQGQLQDQALQPLLDLSATLQGPDRQLNGRLAAAPLPLAGLQAMLPHVSQLSGNLQAGIALSGTLDQPLIRGDVVLQEGSFSVTATQTRVDNAGLELQFDGNQVRYAGAFDMGEGHAVVSGEASWTGVTDQWQEALKLNASIRGHGLNISVAPELEAWVSPQLEVRFDRSLQVDGRLDIEKGQLVVQSLPTSAVAVSKDMRLVGDDLPAQEYALPPATVALQVAFLEPFAVQGFGFNGKIGGALEVRQHSPSAPEVFGNLAVVEGQYKAYGQRLTVKDGRLHFVGPAANPMLQLHAFRPLKGTDVEAGISVSGTLDALQVALYSTPSMEEQAILSYLLRGKAPGGDNPDSQSQALLMATSAGLEMTNASALTDALNSIPLLSDITLDTETDAVNGDTLATVSGYIGERIYLKYGVGILEPVSQVTVRFYLMNQLWLEAISGLERSMDLYYSFDVD